MEIINEENRTDISKRVSLGEMENSSKVSDQVILTTTVAATAQKPKLSHVVEIGAFMYCFAISLSGSVFQSQVIYQTCLVVYHYDKDTCYPLIGTSEKTGTDDPTSEEPEIEIHSSKISMTSDVINSVISSIMLLFIGSWSDKFGRRPILLALSIGYLCKFIIFSILGILALSQEFTPWLYILPALPADICGGICALTSTIYSYITDSTEGRTRAMRLLIAEAYMGIGSVFGGVCGRHILAVANFLTIYCLSTFIMIIACIYTYFLVVETLPPTMTHNGPKMRTYFHFSLVMELLYTGFKVRNNNGRTIIWITIVCSIISRFVTVGELSVVYLFVTKQLKWTLQNYDLYLTISSIVLIPGAIISVLVLRKYFNCPLTIINMICYGGAAIQSLIQGFATHTWEMYLALAIGFMGDIPSSMSLSIQSLATSVTEIGKIFALTTILVTIIPMGAPPFYTFIYNVTLNINPGVYNYISSAFFIIALLLMIAVLLIEKKHLTLPIQMKS